MTALIALAAFVMAAIALILIKSVSDYQNILLVRMDRCERKKAIKKGNIWIVMLKPETGRGQPKPHELEANDESDAMRQIIANRWMDRMTELKKKEAE